MKNSEITMGSHLLNLILTLARIQGITPEALSNAVDSDAQLEYLKNFVTVRNKEILGLLENSKGGVVNE